MKIIELVVVTYLVNKVTNFKNFLMGMLATCWWILKRVDSSSWINSRIRNFIFVDQFHNIAGIAGELIIHPSEWNLQTYYNTKLTCLSHSDNLKIIFKLNFGHQLCCPIS